MDTEFLLKAAKAFIIWRVVRGCLGMMHIYHFLKNPVCLMHAYLMSRNQAISIGPSLTLNKMARIGLNLRNQSYECLRDRRDKSNLRCK